MACGPLRHALEDERGGRDDLIVDLAPAGSVSGPTGAIRSMAGNRDFQEGGAGAPVSPDPPIKLGQLL